MKYQYNSWYDNVLLGMVLVFVVLLDAILYIPTRVNWWLAEKDAALYRNLVEGMAAAGNLFWGRQ